MNYQEIIEKAIEAIHKRTFYAQYPEHPKSYGEDTFPIAEKAYQAQLQKPFKGLLQTGETAWRGEEKSPYTQEVLGITYPIFEVETLIEKAQVAQKIWRKVSIEKRAELLVTTLERCKERFHEIALATHHTTGQAYVMAFQASGPHAADRALEALALAYQELKRFPSSVYWEKPMGRITASLDKAFLPIPKGIGLVIGCSTFPTWNTLPGLFANLMTGNVSIVKPHPTAIYPMAIYVAELQKVLQENEIDTNVIQLAVDSSDNLITKKLAEHLAIQLIDFTGSNAFGSYIESLPNKTVFTEKSGVNSVIVDSADDLREVMRNLAFAVSLYSGQMCTTPQNFFIPSTGVYDDGELIDYATVVDLFRNEVAALSLNPKLSGILGTIQSEKTLERANSAGNLGGNVVLEAPKVTHPQFEQARICAPTIIEVEADQLDIYTQELFGPIVLVIKTKDTQHSLQLAQNLVREKGALTCAAYCVDETKKEEITEAMNEVFAPVSLNFTGMFWVNQHATFSDFHGTGGNPAGNASYTDPLFVNRRFVWVGNREKRS